MNDLKGGAEGLPYLVATLKVATHFIRILMSAVPSLQQLLASGSVTDINEAINLITDMYNFKVPTCPVFPPAKALSRL